MGTTASKAKTKTKEVEVPREDVVRQQIKTTYQAIDRGFLDLSSLLSEAYHNDYHVLWGFDRFEEYCNTELDVHYRKAMDLIGIWDKVKELDLPRSEVDALGWSKMRNIASVIDEKNQSDWLEKARTMSARDVSDAVKLVRRKADGGTSGDVPSVHVMKLVMSDAEASLILDAIEEAKRLCETDNSVVALGMICQDWGEIRGAMPQRATIEDHIRFLEKTYSVELSFKPKKKTKTQKAETEKIVAEAEDKAKAEAWEQSKPSSKANSDKERAPGKKKVKVFDPIDDLLSDMDGDEEEDEGDREDDLFGEEDLNDILDV